ncbi:MAG: hypothetical protein JXR80_11180 [Deltaproteobacteria bacterium]|nr:hypothetical protein [Deltaproteobacteria bacterium]
MFGGVRPNEAAAWELLSGQVKTMVAVGDKIHLTILTEPQTEVKAGADDPFSAKAEIPSTLDFEVLREELPPRLQEGDFVRIWQAGDNQLTPIRITSSRGYDPTGVRARLSGRGRLSGASRGSGKGGHGGGH